MTEQRSNNIKSDTWFYLWLAIGGILLVFSNGIWKIIPLASWLAPVFLLRFLRSQKPGRGLFIVMITHMVAYMIMMQNVLPGMMGYSISAAYGLFFFFPLLADRLIVPRLRGFSATLVFPLAWITLEYVLSIATPYSTWFSLAYTQYGNLPLVQVVSITGIWGVSFLITWFASVTNWVWEQNVNWSKVRGGVGLYTGILTMVLLLGGARLVLFSPQSTTVRVAAVTRSFDLLSHVADCEQGDWECISKVTSESLDVYIEDSQQAVLAGAKIIVWQEGAIWLLEEDEAAFVEQGREFARQHDVYLEMGLMILPRDEDPSYRENKVIMIDPSGNLIWEYLKSEIVPGDIDTPGDGQVPTLDTPYGQIGSVICFDLDWPYLSRQAGISGVDLMLVPADDWLSIDPIHSHMATITAVGNGYSIIRPTFEGLSIAVDYQGRVLVAMDDFTTEEVVMIADVPMEGVKTIYSQIGDFFAWLCVAGCVAIIGWAIVRRKAV